MTSSTETNKALVQRFGEAMNARRLELLDDILAPDFTRHCQATPQVRVSNREEFKEFLRQDLATFPDSVQTPVHLVAENDMVAAWLTYEGTQLGPMGPFPASGKKMRLECGAFIRIANERIAEMWVTWDNVAALMQLGHLPPVPVPA